MGTGVPGRKGGPYCRGGTKGGAIPRAGCRGSAADDPSFGLTKGGSSGRFGRRAPDGVSDSAIVTVREKEAPTGRQCSQNSSIAVRMASRTVRRAGRIAPD
ncbi:MAG: hypothetical protein NVS4B3_07410 [Gemmatimonadaceae bacterium]